MGGGSVVVEGTFLKNVSKLFVLTLMHLPEKHYREILMTFHYHRCLQGRVGKSEIGHETGIETKVQPLPGSFQTHLRGALRPRTFCGVDFSVLKDLIK